MAEAASVRGALAEARSLRPLIESEADATDSALTMTPDLVAAFARTFAYRHAGSRGLRNPGLVQRCFRDMMTGGLHVYVDRRSYEEIGKKVLATARS